MKVDQASRPLPPETLSILVGLTLKFGSLCILVNVVESGSGGNFSIIQLNFSIIQLVISMLVIIIDVALRMVLM